MSDLPLPAKPQRIQLSRAKGFNLQAASMALNGLPAVNCARPGRWGSPYRVDDFGLFLSLALFENTVNGIWSPGLFDGAGDLPIDLAYKLHCDFRKRFDNHPAEAARCELRRRNLACFCGLDQRCHVDLWLELANAK